MRVLQITPQFRDTDTHTSQRITLDGIVIRIDTYTNTWDGLWYLDIFDADDAPLILGILLAVGLDLLYPYRYMPVPPGVLMVQDQNGSPAVDPVLDAFSEERHAIFYIGSGTA